MAAGATIAAGVFLVDGAVYGNWDGVGLAKNLAWTAVGGGTAALFGRAMAGASSWRAAYQSQSIARVPKSFRTKVPGRSGPGGGSKTRVTQDDPHGPIDWGATYANLSVNAGFNAAFCTMGPASIGSAGPYAFGSSISAC